MDLEMISEYPPNPDFEFLSDLLVQFVWRATPNGNRAYFNKSWYTYTGLTFDQTKAGGWTSVLHPDDRDMARAAWNHSVLTGEDYTMEYRIRSENDEYRWFLDRAQSCKDENGQVTKWFGVATDITDRLQLAESIDKTVVERTRKMQGEIESLEASNRELINFAAIATHDLKEPLRKISFSVNALSEKLQSEISAEAQAHVEKLVAATTRLNAVVNDLLSYTKLASDSEFEFTDLNGLVAEVLCEFETTIQEKGVTVETGILPTADVVPAEIRQLFHHIIDNSLKFSKPGVPPVIKIDALVVNELSFLDSFDADGSFYRINIADNGIGFNKENAENIFSLFKRLRPSDEQEGIGIGLAIVQKIVAKHGGIVKASGKESEGACITFVLPFVHADKENESLSN